MMVLKSRLYTCNKSKEYGYLNWTKWMILKMAAIEIPVLEIYSYGTSKWCDGIDE